MQLTGILRSWNDERGYGFIAPSHGGAELFVHISAFPRDGSRPVAGESVAYELSRDGNGKPQAVRVVRRAMGAPSVPGGREVKPKSNGWRLRRFMGPLITSLVVLAFAYALGHFWTTTARSSLHRSVPDSRPVEGAFRCDGRTHCSQMTSCAEATYFLQHCPSVKMDGDGDGVPCEQQWCK